jgi:VIT1/CCC1 family predicted Fe2+/Mn2+ transporter
MAHHEPHRIHSAGWLRAAVLGANDGLLSTSSLVLGMAAAQSGRAPVLLAAVAGLVAGALSMATGEFVSVSSQVDIEKADLARERSELDDDPHGEHRELAMIYRHRGLDPALADQVATQLMAHDDLGAHARDELGMSDITHARPVQAALASAISFATGALPPVLLAGLVPMQHLRVAVLVITVLALAALGFAGGRMSGASPLRASLRVVAWGVLAMACSMFAGHLVGAAV